MTHEPEVAAQHWCRRRPHILQSVRQQADKPRAALAQVAQNGRCDLRVREEEQAADAANVRLPREALWRVRPEATQAQRFHAGVPHFVQQQVHERSDTEFAQENERCALRDGEYEACAIAARHARTRMPRAIWRQTEDEQNKRDEWLAFWYGSSGMMLRFRDD